MTKTSYWYGLLLEEMLVLKCSGGFLSHRKSNLFILGLGWSFLPGLDQALLLGKSL